MRAATDGKAEPEAETRRLAEDLRQSVSRFVRAIRQTAGTARTAQSETLDLLDRLGPVNVATLAQARGVTHQTMRLVVAQLDASGLTRQEPDPSDRRSRLTSLSAGGRNALEEERDTRAAAIANAIETRLSHDERDGLRRAIAILDRLAAPSS